MPTENEKLAEKITKFIDSNDKVIQKMINDNGGLTEEITALKDGLEKAKGELTAYKDQMKERLAGSLGMDENDVKKFSFSKALYAIANNGDFTKAKYEQEIFEETRKKAIDTNSGAGGAYIIPIELGVSEIIKPAMAETVMEKLGVKKMTGLTADLDLPEATNRPTLSFGADGAEVTAQDINWATKPLRPKHGKMLTKVSNNLLIQQAAAEPWVKELMQEGVTLGIDNEAINGTGDESRPLGILNTSGTNTTAIGNTRMTLDNVSGMIEDIEEQDFQANAALFRPKIKSGIIRERIPQFSGDTQGDYIFDKFAVNPVENYLGVKFAWTTQVPVASNQCQTVVGKWDEFIIALWGNIRIKVSDVAGTALTQDQTWIAMFVNMDTRVRRPLAFDIASGCKYNF